MPVYVEIRDAVSGNVERRFGPYDRRQAEKVKRGVQINMNHEEYECVIVDDRREGEA